MASNTIVKLEDFFSTSTIGLDDVGNKIASFSNFEDLKFMRNVNQCFFNFLANETKLWVALLRKRLKKMGPKRAKMFTSLPEILEAKKACATENILINDVIDRLTRDPELKWCFSTFETMDSLPFVLKNLDFLKLLRRLEIFDDSKLHEGDYPQALQWSIGKCHHS